MPQSSKYVVKVQNRSGFDKSHRNSLTLQCGTLTPILCDELIPGSRVNLKLNLACQLAPLVSETYMNVKLKAEAFFVPSRLLCKSFEDFYCDSKDTNTMIFWQPSSDMQLPDPLVSSVQAMIPNYSITNSNFASYALAPGSLADYLGFCFDPNNAGAVYNFNILPFIAYHLIWQEWYRNPRVQRPAFVPYVDDNTGHVSLIPVMTLPYQYLHAATVDTAGNNVPANYVFMNTNTAYSDTTSDIQHACADGVSIFALRQRNFGHDYFTNGRIDTQQGDMSRVVAPDNSQGDAEFTIAALRLMNSLQQYKERNNIPSPRMVDVSLNRYGVKMSDGVAQRPICIGVASYDVYSRGVDQTTPGTSGNNEFNVFASVGTVYGKAHAVGSDFIIDDFEAKEPGYLMVLVSLVPEATYTAGIKPMFSRYMVPGSITDMANPMLQNVGDQPIFAYEASGAFSDFANRNANIFAYTDRYADWMFMPNEVHGELRSGRSLEQFVLQRVFSNSPRLNTAFLEIPKDYFDTVLVHNRNGDLPTADMGFAAWLDSMLQYRVSMPLAEYSVPSLQNPAYEHGKTVVLRRNGQVF